jgi:exosome complex exonuclease RRP6
MDALADYASYQERVTAALVQATKTTTQIVAQDLSFQRSTNANVSGSLDRQSERLLGLANSLLKVAASGSDIEPPVLEDEDSVEDKWKRVVDVIDQLLEKADACLDEFTGIIKKLSPAQNERGLAIGRKSEAAAQFPSVYNYGSSKIAKPQLLFDQHPNNLNDSSPFKPILRSKPHAIIPLSESLTKSPGQKEPRSYVSYWGIPPLIVH